MSVNLRISVASGLEGWRGQDARIMGLDSSDNYVTAQISTHGEKPYVTQTSQRITIRSLEDVSWDTLYIQYIVLTGKLHLDPYRSTVM
jgi:hypothetical protein